MNKKIAVAMSLALACGMATAADHFDAPFTDGAIPGGSFQNPDEIDLLEKALDIADAYAFPGPSGDTVVFIMTIFPLADSSSRLNPNVLYQFKIDTNEDLVEDQVIQITVDGTGENQTVSTTGVTTPTVLGAANNEKLPPVLTGVPFNTVGGDGTLQLFAGLSDDPFFFDLAAFGNFTAELRGDPGFDGDPSTVVGFAPSQNAEAPNDTLQGLNIISIVIEVPKSQLGAGAGQVTFWATTNVDNEL